MPQGTAGPSFSVLVVCRANHCRSPLMEHLLRAEVARRGLPWTISSAGTEAQSGRPMHRHARRVLRSRQLDAHGWVSTQLTREAVLQADLVVTAARLERESVSRLAPEATPYTYPLLPLAHLLGAVPGQTAADPSEVGPRLLASAKQVQTQTQPLPVDRRDLPDPMGRLYPSFVSCAARIDAALSQILPAAPAEPWEWHPAEDG